MEGCRIRDELIIACSNSRPSSSQFPRVSPLCSINPTGFSSSWCLGSRWRINGETRNDLSGNSTAVYGGAYPYRRHSLTSVGKHPMLYVGYMGQFVLPSKRATEPTFLPGRPLTLF